MREPAFVCRRCGQSWPAHPVLGAPCPRCGAPAGQWCRRPSGHSGQFVDPHVERERAALDAGLLGRCPAADSPAPGPAGGFQRAAAPDQLSLFANGMLADLPGEVSHRSSRR